MGVIVRRLQVGLCGGESHAQTGSNQGRSFPETMGRTLGSGYLSDQGGWTQPGKFSDFVLSLSFHFPNGPGGLPGHS